MSITIDRGAPASAKTDSGLRGSHAVRWWVLVVLGMAQLMIMLDATVVNIALPEAQQDLGFSDGSRQWVITGYALAFGSLLLLGGRLGDLLGRRTLFVIGLAGFGAASILGRAVPEGGERVAELLAAHAGDRPGGAEGGGDAIAGAAVGAAGGAGLAAG
jgi:MFS family permease